MGVAGQCWQMESALRKTEGSPVLWTCEIQGAQHDFYAVGKESRIDSPGLVDFAIGLVNSVLNLHDRQVKNFEEFDLQKNCEINAAHQKILGASWNDIWARKC